MNKNKKVALGVVLVGGIALSAGIGITQLGKDKAEPVGISQWPETEDKVSDNTQLEVEDNDEKPVVEDMAPNNEKPVVEDTVSNDKKPVVEDKAPNNKKPAVEDKAPNNKKPVVEDKVPNDKKPVVEDKVPNDKKPVTENNQSESSDKPIFNQKEMANSIKSLNSFNSNSQIIYPDNKNLTVMLTGGYKNGMGLAFLKLPSISISNNFTQNTIDINFNNRFGDIEKQFLREFLRTYYPNSYEKVYSDVINHKASVGNGNYIEKTYDNHSFGIARVGEDLMPVVSIGKE